MFEGIKSRTNKQTTNWTVVTGSVVYAVYLQVIAWDQQTVSKFSHLYGQGRRFSVAE